MNLGGNNLTVGTTNSTTYNGVIEGVGGSLTKIGTGTLTLSGASTFTGGLTVNGGAVSVAALGANLADISGVTLGGGELIITTSSSSNDNITLNTGTDTLAGFKRDGDSRRRDFQRNGIGIDHWGLWQHRRHYSYRD